MTRQEERYSLLMFSGSWNNLIRGLHHVGWFDTIYADNICGVIAFDGERFSSPSDNLKGTFI